MARLWLDRDSQSANAGLPLSSFPIRSQPPRRQAVYHRRIGRACQLVKGTTVAASDKLSLAETSLMKVPEPLHCLWYIDDHHDYRVAGVF